MERFYSKFPPHLPISKKEWEDEQPKPPFGFPTPEIQRGCPVCHDWHGGEDCKPQPKPQKQDKKKHK